MKQQRKSLLCKLALISCGYGMFSDSVIVPILTNIYNEFPQSGIFLNNFVVTGGYLFSLIAAVLTGIYINRVSKRKLLISAMICFIIGGVGGCLSSSMEFLALTRIIDGISDGMINVVAMSLISEIYTDEKERAQTIALHTGVGAGFGVLLSLFSGIIAQSYNWRYAFLLNFGSVLSLICIILAVPDTKREDNIEELPLKERLKRSFTKKTTGIYLLHFVAAAWYCILFVFVDLYVHEKSFGASALSGIISSAGSITTFITGFCFAPIYIKIKDTVGTAGNIGLAITFLILCIVNTTPMAFVMFVLAAFFYTMLNSYYTFKISISVNEEDVGLCMGMMNSVYNLGCFLSSYIPYGVMALFKVDTVSSSLGYLSAVPAAIGLILGIKVLNRK